MMNLAETVVLSDDECSPTKARLRSLSPQTYSDAGTDVGVMCDVDTDSDTESKSNNLFFHFCLILFKIYFVT